jgi:uncharacterized protein YkwD
LIITLLSFSSCAKKTAPSSSASASRPETAENASPPASSSNSMENGILYYVNLHRRSIGLGPLQMNGVESSVAARHSRDMATGRTDFGHTGAKSRENAISRQIGPVMSMGENVAYGERSAKEVVDDWLHSPGHRRNIEGNFKLTGIGLAKDRQGVIYYTQIFTR